MSSYVKITGRAITIWLLASLINGLLCGISLSIIYNNYNDITGEIIGIGFLSLLFSAPGFFIFWIVLILKISTHTVERALFRSALITGFILTSISGYVGAKMFSSEFDNYSAIPASCILLSAMTSIMFHFKYFKKIK